MKRVATIILLVLSFLSLSGQILQGVVLDKDTEIPISYVSIGIINKEGGTYSDPEGKFQFTLTAYDKNDSLRFSCIGYKSVTFRLSEHIERYGEKSQEVFLEKESIRLQGVEVFPRDYREKEIGNKISNRHICICGFQDREGGILIRNKKTLLLDKLTFNLSSDCSQIPDSVLFRVNIYSLNNDLPSELILTEPVYFMLRKGMQKDKITIDLEKYRIAVHDDFAATLEIINTFGKGKICYAGWISGNPTFFKYGKQGKWAYPVDDKKQKLKIFMSMVFSTRIEK